LLAKSVAVASGADAVHSAFLPQHQKIKNALAMTDLIPGIAVQSIAGRLFAMAFQERFPNHKTISNVSCSTLFIHGESDGLIPVEHSVNLFKRCRSRKLLVTPPEMEHNSNLFGDASFLAIPAIHFFGFPGYYTSTPPRLPASMFETPDRRVRLANQVQEGTVRPFLCDCLAKRDQNTLDAGFARQADGVDNITICLYKDTSDEVELVGEEAKERLRRKTEGKLLEKQAMGKSHVQADGDLGAGEVEEPLQEELASVHLEMPEFPEHTEDPPPL